MVQQQLQEVTYRWGLSRNDHPPHTHQSLNDMNDRPARHMHCLQQWRAGHGAIFLLPRRILKGNWNRGARMGGNEFRAHAPLFTNRHPFSAVTASLWSKYDNHKYVKEVDVIDRCQTHSKKIHSQNRYRRTLHLHHASSATRAM